MIVNYNECGWEIITQRAHGILAAQLAQQWKPALRPARWTETLLAIAEHDDAEVELDGENLLTPQGGPLNFSMKKFELEHCLKLSRFSITKSRYIALLTSMHMCFLYKPEEAANEQVRSFLQNQRRLQERWMKDLGLAKAESEKIYSLLEWCDAFSLLLCQHQLQPEQRAVDVSRGPDNKNYQLFRVADNTLTLKPWPFEAPAFSVYVESRIINQLQFASSAELREAFHKAPVKETIWELVKTRIPAKRKKI